jgi:hypothetical protein
MTEKRDSFLVRLNAIIQPGLSCFTQSSLGKSPYAVAVALDSLKLHGAYSVASFKTPSK